MTVTVPAEVRGEDVEPLVFAQERVEGAAVAAVDHVTLVGFPEGQHPETQSESMKSIISSSALYNMRSSRVVTSLPSRCKYGRSPGSSALRCDTRTPRRYCRFSDNTRTAQILYMYFIILYYELIIIYLIK